MDKIVTQRVLLCIDFVYLMSYPEMQYIIPGDGIYHTRIIQRCDISYTEMQCRIRKCNVVSGDAIHRFEKELTT